MLPAPAPVAAAITRSSILATLVLLNLAALAQAAQARPKQVRARLTEDTPLYPSKYLRCDVAPQPQFIRWKMSVGHLLGLSSTSNAATSNEDGEDWVPEEPEKTPTLPVADPKLPECRVLNFKSPFRGIFVREADTGHVGFQLKQCRLRRLTSQQALGCLASKHIVFVGDSMTRFQFIGLAHLLTKGRFHHAPDDVKEGLSFVAPSIATGLGRSGVSRGEVPFTPGAAGQKQAMKRPRSSRTSQDAGPSRDPWTVFYDNTQRALSRRGCVNVTCSCYRNLDDHAVGQDPLSRVHEYWRVRMLLEDDSKVLLSMALVYAFPDFVTAGINGLRWAFSASRGDPPDLVLFNMGTWWGYVHNRRQPEVSIGQVLAAFEEIFSWGATHVKQQGLHTRLVYKTSVPLTADSRKLMDSLWWKVWPTKVEPLLITMARALGWEVLDARDIITTAKKQSISTHFHRDPTHLQPFMLDRLNDVLLGGMCSSQGWVGLPPAEHIARLG